MEAELMSYKGRDRTNILDMHQEEKMIPVIMLLNIGVVYPTAVMYQDWS